MSALTNEQIALLRDIRMKGAINALLFSKFCSAGVGLRDMGMIDGVGDSTAISAAGMAALLEADAKLRKPKADAA